MTPLVHVGSVPAISLGVEVRARVHGRVIRYRTRSIATIRLRRRFRSLVRLSGEFDGCRSRAIHFESTVQRLMINTTSEGSKGVATAGLGAGCVRGHGLLSMIFLVGFGKACFVVGIIAAATTTTVTFAGDEKEEAKSDDDDAASHESDDGP